MDKCREAFERFECEKYEANYDDMKKNWDWYESQFGYRYSPESLRGKDWAVWQKAWQHQQAKVEELEGKLKQAYEDVDTFAEAHERECGFKAQLAKDKAELQKRVDFLEQILNKATEVVELNIETVEQSRDKAKDMQERNYSASMLYFLKPIRRVLEQALKGGCKHESDGTNRLSLPPKTKCKKCGEFYSAHELKEGDQ
ncbi:hypothetical protein V8P84_07135 [Acinetobacter baumannii]